MGTWGPEPWENDSTGNMMDTVKEAMDKAAAKEVRKIFKNWKALDSHDSYPLVGVVQVLVANGHAVPVSAIKASIAILKRCLADKQYAADWQDSGADFKSAAKDFLQRLEKSLEDFRRLRRERRRAQRISTLVRDGDLEDENVPY